MNDSTLLGGNAPFQPMAVVSGGSVDNPGGRYPAARICRWVSRRRTSSSSIPTSYMWSAGVQREVPFGFIVDVTYVGRRGLYLPRERNINQLLPGTIAATRE